MNNEAVAAPPVEQAASASVKVTIKEISETGGFIVNTYGRVLPEAKAIYAHLDPEYKKVYKIRKHSYYSIESMISATRSTIPVQGWADAISAAIMTQLGNAEGATSELHHLTQGGYLALGDTLYKLSAISQIPQQKALVTARAKVRATTEAERKSLLEDAKMNAKALTESAVSIRDQATSYKRQVERESGAVPPRWMFQTGYAFKYSSGLWEIQLPLTFYLSAFDIDFEISTGEKKKYSWEAQEQPFPKKIYVWVPVSIDGSYTATSIHVDYFSESMPHISHSSGCMSLGAGPKKLNSARDIESLKNALEYAHSRVQLDSLYIDVPSLLKNYKSAFPTDLYEALKTNGVYGAQLLAEKAGAKLVNEKEDARLVWKA